MKRAAKVTILLFLLLLAPAAAFLGWLAWDWRTPFAARPGEVLIHVPRGTGAGQVLEDLHKAGIVRSRLSVKLAYSLYGRPLSLKAGTYKFDKPLTPLQVIDKLNSGEILYVKITIPEGLRLDEVTHLLAENGLGKENEFRKLTADPRGIRDLDPEADTLEGYLFPETYLLDPGLSEEAVVQVLLKGFRGWWQARAAGQGTAVSAREVVTLASLVEKETASPDERGVIAGVFLNRLSMGMPLQTDPSIIYAEILAGDYKGALTRDDWNYPSPYNTYANAGLPPGPICSPGRASLDAALRPTPTKFLYFVSRKDGTHAFSRTLEEHNHAVARYQHGPAKGRRRDQG